MSWGLLLLATPLLSAVGYFSGVPWLLPILQVLSGYPVMVQDLRLGKPRRAILCMLLWALLIAVTVSSLTVGWPESGAESILHGAVYRDQMLEWVRTGVGAESTPSQFIPEHLLHISAFIVLALVTGSLLALALGAVLMNYMSFYVGSLLSLSEQPGIILIAGWPPWSILRVVSFVILGVALSLPFLHRLGVVEPRWMEKRRWMAAAGVGLVLDILLKTMLADAWSRLLRGTL